MNFLFDICFCTRLVQEQSVILKREFREQNWLSKTWFFLWGCDPLTCSLGWLPRLIIQVTWPRWAGLLREGKGGGDVEGPSFVISRLVILHSWVTCAQQRGEKVPFPPDIHPQHFFPEDDEWLPGTIYKPLSKAWGWYPERVKVHKHTLPFKPGK